MKKVANFKFPISVQQQSLETIVNQTITSNTDVTGKADKATTLAGYGITDAYTQEQTNSQIATEVAKIVANAPEDFDTLKEVADWIKSDTTGAAKMQSDITALNAKITSGTEELEDGVSTLEKGKVYFVIE